MPRCVALRCLPQLFERRRLHRANLDRSAAVEHRTPAREFDRLRQIARLDDEAEHHVLGFDERAIGDGALRAAHHGATGPDRLTALLEMAAAFEIADPREPLLQA